MKALRILLFILTLLCFATVIGAIIVTAAAFSKNSDGQGISLLYYYLIGGLLPSCIGVILAGLNAKLSRKMPQSDKWYNLSLFEILIFIFISNLIPIVSVIV